MEHEITGHSRKIYKISKDKSTSFWKKVREIAIEVGIIVFAVSLAAYLERSREHSHEQAAVKDFLLGLKTDLQSDIKEMESDKISYIGAGAAFNYILGLKKAELPNKDSLAIHRGYFSNTTGLITNNGRFEGFKSSGRIVTIENKELQNDIMDLYQENIPSLLASTNAYTRRKEKLWDHIIENKKRITDSTSNYAEILGSERTRTIAEGLSFTDEIIDRYGECIKKAKKIIEAIDKTYTKSN
jgi:hypothetical protein